MLKSNVEAYSLEGKEMETIRVWESVYVLIHTHKHGTNVYLHLSFDGLLKKISEKIEKDIYEGKIDDKKVISSLRAFIKKRALHSTIKELNTYWSNISYGDVYDCRLILLQE